MSTTTTAKIWSNTAAGCVQRAVATFRPAYDARNVDPRLWEEAVSGPADGDAQVWRARLSSSSGHGSRADVCGYASIFVKCVS